MNIRRYPLIALTTLFVVVWAVLHPKQYDDAEFVAVISLTLGAIIADILTQSRNRKRKNGSHNGEDSSK